MKQVYGFKAENPADWGDIFEDDDKTPEVLISSACHIYYSEEGECIVGFDMSLGLPRKTMKDLLKNHCSSPKLFSVL